MGGQAAPKHKGKISRVLAAKASLATRVDALTDETIDNVDTTIGYDGRARVEARLRQLEGSNTNFNSSHHQDGILSLKNTQSYDPVAVKTSAKSSYIDSNDIILNENTESQANSENKSVIIE